jgi:radical SAM superfamily enzyme YgiQ (UPF0313 family)
MKVALVNPKNNVFEMRMIYDTHENLALGQIASYLLEANNYSVYLMDCRVDGLTETDVAKHIISNQVQVVGLSVNYVTFPSAIEIAREIKLLKRDIVIIFGGEHVSYQDDEVLRKYKDYVDYIIRGESEITFLELTKAIDSRLYTSDIQGISFLKGNKIIRTSNRTPIVHLDSLPHANRTIAKRAINKNKEIEMGILTQRGCPFPCSFCNANRFLSNESKMTVRQRTPSDVVNEMQEISTYIYKNRSFLRFYDATFVTKSKVNRKWIDELCNEIEKQKVKIPFDVFIRADSFDFTKENDKQLINRLKQAGMISTYIGLESGSEQTLGIYNKKVGVNESERAFNYIKKININGSTNGCMTFQQESTIEEIVETVQFLYRIGLCSFWNCLSRAETLPGINLEMNTEERKTCWDIYNYKFTNKEVEKLYTVMSGINREHKSIRIEDRIIRYLRDRIRIEIFYNESQIHFDSIQDELEKTVQSLQKLTSNFIIYLSNCISDINTAKISKLTLEYISEHNKQLDYIYKKYGWILELHETKTNILGTGTNFQAKVSRSETLA